MTEEEQLALLAGDGMLIKRPLLVGRRLCADGLPPGGVGGPAGMRMRVDFAPLDGITKVVFRQVWHRRFGGADRYFIPFFLPHGPAWSHLGTGGSWTRRPTGGSPPCPRS